MLGGSYEEQHTVVLLGFAKFPGSEEPVGVGFNVAALQGFHGGDHELDARFVFKFFEFCLEFGTALRRHDIGLIDHAAGQWWEIQRECQRSETKGKSSQNAGLSLHHSTIRTSPAAALPHR